MKDNRMDNIVECAYNMDNGYVEVWFTDGNMLRIKCEEVEAALRTTEQSLAKLHRLLDNKPIEYLKKGIIGLQRRYWQGSFLGMRVNINGYLVVNIV